MEGWLLRGFLLMHSPMVNIKYEIKGNIEKKARADKS